MKSLPAYKKLIFYGEDENLRVDQLRPVFDMGNHVLILESGFKGWKNTVLTAPNSVTTVEETRQDAVAKYFKGESALGTPQPLKRISAENFIRGPELKSGEKRKVEEEGC